MIDFNHKTKTFNLLSKSAFYAMQIDQDGRLIHMGMGHRPIKCEGPVVSGLYQIPNWIGNTIEVPCFGDLACDEVALKISFPPAQGAGSLPIRDFRPRYESHDIVEDAQPGLSPAHGQSTLVSSPRQTLRIQMRDIEYDFYVRACYRLTPEHDILEAWLELDNRTADTVEIEQCFFASWTLPFGRYLLTYLDGFWGTEMHISRETLSFGTKMLESRTIHTSAYRNPFFMLNRVGHAGYDNGEVFFGQLSYSGNWRLAFEYRHDLSLRVHGGYNPFDFQMFLPPSATHSTPAFVFGISENGWDGASARLHAFQRERLMPRAPDAPRLRPVLFNTSEALGYGLSQDRIISLARKASTIGVELFCIDDGWFSARRSPRAGLGDWTPSREVFPSGLQPLIDEIHNLGMRFGLWVEPEMVNPDSELFRAHPDWTLGFPRRPRTEHRNQFILDFGRPEVVEYVYNSLENLLSVNTVDFIKWDMNRIVTEPGSVCGKAIWLRHTEAVYSIIDRLRARHPGVTFESCSSGGARIDAGILSRAEEVWISDNTDPLCCLATQEGFSYAYCPRAMTSWVTSKNNQQTGRSSSLGLRFDVAMRGVLGLSVNLLELSEEDLICCARHISFYKRCRSLIQDGNCHRLQELDEHNASVWQFVDHTGSESVVSIVVRDHRSAQYHPYVKLKGLRTGSAYVGKDHHGRIICKATGAELMALGLPVHQKCDGMGSIHIAYSRTIHFRIAD